MCGIAGVIHLEGQAPVDPALLRRMAAAVEHRGPDEFGIYRDRQAGLAHARLSIIDLAHGQQPLCNGDGSLWITYNGEIFNYVELREELKALGHRFRTACDTEVVVQAYEAWGERCVERFNGQFAFVIWDSARRRAFLARDPVGIRPLYHAREGRRFLFASEVKSIFSDPAFPRGLDPEGIDQAFTFWTTLAPVTPFRGIGELRPGHVMIVDAAGSAFRTRTRSYWEPRYAERDAPAPLSLEEATEELAARLETATRLRMLRSDVPVGSYLSGGIDSSVIASLGRRAKEGDFRTFSLRFTDPEYDETLFQRMMVEHLGSDHTDLLCSRQDIAAVFPDVIRHTERPVLRSAPAPLFLLSRLVRDAGFKVVLTGEGADEILAGYDIFREAKVRAFWARDPGSPSRPRLLERLYPYLARSPVAARAMARKFFGQGLDRLGEPEFSHDPRWSAASALKRLFSAEMESQTRELDVVEDLRSDLPDGFESWDLLPRAQYLEVRTILSGYLLSSQGDRMLMANSVEGRFPFLDRDVMEFCNDLPARYKLKVLDEKHILKRMARGLLPRAVLQRPKQPYRSPDALSFVSDGAPGYVAELLAPSMIAEADVFDPDGVGRLYEKCRARAGDGQFSNADNMAFLGVLSTQLLWDLLVRPAPTLSDPPRARFVTEVDRTAEPTSA